MPPPPQPQFQPPQPPYQYQAPMMQPPQPVYPPPPQPGNYPVWNAPPQPVIPQSNHRGASPTAPDMFERPVVSRSHAPQVAGFGQKKPQLLQPWMLIVGALVMAGLAFAITRLLLS
jgi:hypothetical protein